MTATGLEVESMQSSLLARVARRARRDLPFFVLAGGIYGLDQLTKVLVRGGLALGESWPSESWLIKITHITNSGAAFGILQSQGVFLTITAFAAIAAIFFYYAYPPLEHGLLRFALGLLLGGAIGNLTDRLRFGEVTDFFDFPYYPAFNIADSSIVVGLVIVVAFLLLRGGGARSKSEAAIEPSSGSPPASRAEPGEPRPDTDG